MQVALILTQVDSNSMQVELNLAQVDWKLIQVDWKMVFKMFHVSSKGRKWTKEAKMGQY